MQKRKNDSDWVFPIECYQSNGKIIYKSNRKGELCFFYREKISLPTKAHASVSRTFETKGIIPKEIIEKGEEAIKEYAGREVKKEIDKQKAEAAEYDEFAKNPDFPITVEYDNKILKGKIISADDSVLTVRLEEPYQGEKYVIFGFASGMAGHYIFSGRRTFSEHAIESAKNLLVKIFKEKKYYEEHRELIDLAKKLNQEEK